MVQAMSDFGITPSQLQTADRELGILELFTAYDSEGEAFYVYMSVLPSKYEAYLRAQKTHDTIKFEDFGTVLASGWGKTPPEEVKREMEAKHGVNHNFKAELEAAIEVELAK